MRVEYIQPVCPYCNRGLYFETISADTAHKYFCSGHGYIDPRLVRHIVCEYQDGTELMPAPYATETDTSGGSRVHWGGSTVYYGRKFAETEST